MFILELAWWQIALAVLVAIVGAARLTRVVTYDDFPPAVKLRVGWHTLMKGSDWGSLFACAWCFGFWATALAVGTFLLTFLHVGIAWAWWLVWGTLAMSYLVSQYVHFDEGTPESE